VLLVVAILGLLAMIAVPRFAHSSYDAKVNVCRANIAMLNTQIDLNAAMELSPDGGNPLLSDTERYPANQTEFETRILKPEKFPDGVPECPFGLPYVYDPVKRRIRPHDH
jgi:type II secretory pathway pseudopilin PulG